MKMFGHEVENATVVETRTDAHGDVMHRIRFQYVERAVSDAVWHTWQYEQDVKDLGL